jgi:hypothetical protein
MILLRSQTDDEDIAAVLQNLIDVFAVNLDMANRSGALSEEDKGHPAGVAKVVLSITADNNLNPISDYYKEMKRNLRHFV